MKQEKEWEGVVPIIPFKSTMKKWVPFGPYDWQSSSTSPPSSNSICLHLHIYTYILCSCTIGRYLPSSTYLRSLACTFNVRGDVCREISSPLCP